MMSYINNSYIKNIKDKKLIFKYNISFNRKIMI